ncbi:MAG: hypothetical protein V7K38_15080 [Nostoc sp.]
MNWRLKPLIMVHYELRSTQRQLLQQRELTYGGKPAYSAGFTATH